MHSYVAGQRWISEPEPELGLGTILKVDTYQITVHFSTSQTTRIYSTESAPLKRVYFSEGDLITTNDGEEFEIERVHDDNGVLIYSGAGHELPETLLSDSIRFNKPQERLFHGQVDSLADYKLRCDALQLRHKIRSSDVCGFVGGRVDLIPHQTYVSHEVSGRIEPRVLLADEVGLGKTIESCLILHRLLLTGRISRVLILLPESLIHQWFVELWRRFNLWFTIIDEARCEATNPDENPFSSASLVLSNIKFVSQDSSIREKVLAGDWDMLIIDEAHHLQWSPEKSGLDYQLVEKLSKKVNALLLLTATPEQLGRESHFARLRLLDPDRYYDFATFEMECQGDAIVAEIADKLLAGKSLNDDDKYNLLKIFANNIQLIKQRLQELEDGKDGALRLLILELLDQHGMGRVMFRNTRSTMSGFPKRLPKLIPLTCQDKQIIDEDNYEFSRDRHWESAKMNYLRSPQIDWLVDFIQQNSQEKVLLICRTKEKVFAIEEALRNSINIKLALFHENLTLIQRDRNAAWFAEDGGAQMLICSEIGSEGRNFQFAHKMILFDLPYDLEVIEQRIGRLDRIGQKDNIEIYIPYLIGSQRELYVNWCHSAVRIFDKPMQGGFETFSHFKIELDNCFLDNWCLDDDNYQQLLEQTKTFCHNLQDELEKGRDKLLELNSYRPKAARGLVEKIRIADEDCTLDKFMLQAFEYYGVEVEEIHHRTHFIKPTNLFSDALPAIREDGMNISFDRQKVLSRTDIDFVSREHPMVSGALDLMLGASHGNCTFVTWKISQDKETTIIEAYFILQAICDISLHVDRFLAPVPIRVVIDENRQDKSKKYPKELFDKELKNSDLTILHKYRKEIKKQVPIILKSAQEIAITKMNQIKKEAMKKMFDTFNYDIERLEILKKVNPTIRDSEITKMIQHRDTLHQAIIAADITLDCVKLVWNE